VGAVGAAGTCPGEGPVAFDVDDEVEVGAVAAAAAGVLVVEEVAADVAGGVGAAGGRAAGRLAVGVGGLGEA
jgi:hypothetical protein